MVEAGWLQRGGCWFRSFVMIVCLEDVLDGRAVVPSLEELDGDGELRRVFFPCVEEGVYLAHAGVAPLSGPAAAELARWAARLARGFSQVEYEREAARARQAAARLCGVEPSEVALLGPTSAGLSLVALGLDWRAGDEVVINSQDYPANVYVWRELARRGVVVRELVPQRPGRVDAEMLAAVLASGRVRLVALASAHFLSGRVLDVEKVALLCRQAGALFCLDGIQTLGAVRTPLDGVDFCAADSHKWLLGPVGAGIFVVKKERQEMLRPALVGAENVRTRRYIASREIEWVEGAARYEPGVLNLPGIVAMRASMELLASWGMEAVEARLTALKRLAWERLSELGCEFLGEAPERERGAMLAFRHRKVATPRLHAELAREGFVTSLRWAPDGTEWVRISPHVCIRFEDVENFCACCRRLVVG
jgi:selenocysteine lyase/cysteine desulfurase